ncbi:MAG: primosomal protein N' [Pseudomonadota bacterium]
MTTHNPQTYPQVSQRLKEKQEDKGRAIPVAVDVPLNQTFDYLAPNPAPAAGTRVRVSFGRRNTIGLVWGHEVSATNHTGDLKTVSECVDEQPLIDSATMRLLEFAARYYHHPPGEVFAAALPGVLRSGNDATLEQAHWSLSEAGTSADNETLAKRAPAQAALLGTLRDTEHPLDEATLDAQLGPQWRRLRKPLNEKGWIVETRKIRFTPAEVSPPEPGPTLNSEQAIAVDAILDAKGFSSFLLDGVTGSGKTEVYLAAIANVLSEGGQVLLLVPEISLTPQLARRIASRLGVEPTLFHSGLSERERAIAWLSARHGTRQLFIATRSGVFLPLCHPRLFIVDEEHDSSLKQHEGFRYHARDLAVWRASDANVPIVLGSATPALETLANAKAGRYQHLRLTRRAGNARPPRLSVIDMNRFNVIDGLAQPAVDAMRAHLERGKQVLVYINRRGYAPTLICSSCGHIAECTNCDAHMTVHLGAGRLQCHHCGHREEMPSGCTVCGAVLKPLGEGTERVEHALRTTFSEYNIARIDSDTMSNRGALETVLEDARAGRLSILIGTQMLAKGHHLPNVTLVIIVNLDQGFFASDLRASERLAQSLVQVAGRAGRADEPGEVLVQTAFPHHPLLATLATEGYPAFASAALDERRKAAWPPYRHLAVLHAAAKTEQRVVQYLRAAGAAINAANVEVLGPAPAAMLRRQNRYRYRLLLQASERRSLQASLDQLTTWLASRREDHDVRWSLDVDPQHDI